jgi:hypothetical protein
LDIDILDAAKWIVGVAGGVGVLWAIFVWAKRIIAGTLCHLRSDMLRTYYRHHEDKTIRQYELENFILAYEAYRALGGNSFIQKIHDEVVEWEVLS